MFQRSQLLEPFRFLKRGWIKLRKRFEKTNPVNVQTEVEKSGPTRWNWRPGKVQGETIFVRHHLNPIGIPDGVGIVEPRHKRDNFRTAAAHFRHGAIDDLGLDERLITLDIHNERVGIQIDRRLSETIRATLVVGTGHFHFTAETFHGSEDADIIRGDDDSAHGGGLLNTPIDVLYQCFSSNFDDGFARETGGAISGGDDRDGGL
jgi:hypothetical protein